MELHRSGWMVVNQVEPEKTAEINITGMIGGNYDWYGDSDPDSINTKEKMRAELKAISEIKASKIIVNIDSCPGGSVTHGLSIHDMLVQHPAQVETRIYGLSASIATIIAQSGDVRKISDNALMLIHRASNIAMGNAKELQAQIEFLNSVDIKLVNIYTKKGAEKEKIEELMDVDNGNGKWIDGNEAKEIGLIDEVFEPTMRAAAVYDRNLFNKLKYPALPNNYNTMNENDVKTFGEKLDTLINKVSEFFAPKPADPPAGETITLEASVEKIKNLETELNALKAEKAEALRIKTEAEALKAEADSIKAEADAKKVEADALLTELRELKNSWKPEGRQSDGGKVDGIDKVKEMVKKANENNK